MDGAIDVHHHHVASSPAFVSLIEADGIANPSTLGAAAAGGRRGACGAVTFAELDGAGDGDELFASRWSRAFKAIALQDSK